MENFAELSRTWISFLPLLSLGIPSASTCASTFAFVFVHYRWIVGFLYIPTPTPTGRSMELDVKVAIEACA